MSKELVSALDALEEEKGIKSSYIFCSGNSCRNLDRADRLGCIYFL